MTLDPSRFVYTMNLPLLIGILIVVAIVAINFGSRVKMPPGKITLWITITSIVAYLGWYLVAPYLSDFLSAGLHNLQQLIGG